MFSRVFLSFTILLFSAAAFAERPPIELRAPVGFQISNPTSLNEGITTDMQIRELVLFGGDALLGFDDWYFGARFNSVQWIKFSNNNIYEVAAHIFSLLAQKRFVYGSNYFAPTLSLGIYQPSVVNARLNGVDTIQYTSGKTRTASLGLEAGWILDVYVLGAEVGYQYLTMDDFSGSDGSRFLTPSGAERNANLSGPYLKFILGIHL
jgi:hypothetical protein